MKTILTLMSACIGCCLFAQVKPNTLTPQEKKAGWQLLFNGRNTDGWHNFNKSTIGSAWKVASGCLYLDTAKAEGWQTQNGGDIVYEKTVTDFHLKLEWKISKNGNSGIMFYVQEGERYQYPWQTGPEMQVLDNVGHDDGRIPKHRAGDLYDLISCAKETVKPYNQWNRVDIISRQGKLTLRLNGTVVVRADLRSEEWKNLVAGSKFSSMPGFGSFHSGKIALQDHGNKVWFRNIKLKEF